MAVDGSALVGLRGLACLHVMASFQTKLSQNLTQIPFSCDTYIEAVPAHKDKKTPNMPNI